MADNIARWHAEHGNFARLLDLLESQLELFHGGEAPDYGLMLDVMYYMTHFPDLFHHPREDLTYAKVKERDPRMGRVVDEVMKQHVVLRESGEELVESLDSIVDGAGILARENVEAPGRTYIEYFRNHMHEEETELFPAARTVLRDEDWRAINAAMRDQDDPLFGSSVEKRYEALHRQIARQAGCGCGT
jgi:hemerythrin-like domain-containing protein